METFDIKDLVAVNLKYGSSAKPLKILAFAQLAAKALFLTSDFQKIEIITSGITKLIGVKKISESLVEEGLDYLLEIKKVKNYSDSWCLTEDTRKDIGKDLDASRYFLNKVIKAHFPSTIDEKVLKLWFKEASATFFGCYCDEWVAAVSKGIKDRVFRVPKTIDDLLKPTIKKYGIGDYEPSLINGFIKFISSDDTIDQQYLMLISQAMFSSRLVAADIGSDLIAIEELRGSKFILDTNVLFAISLEGHKIFPFIGSLEDALKTIKSQLIYLHTTKEEYGRALTGKRNTVLHLVDNFPNEIINDVNDDFIATAKIRKCTLREDYERFFDSLLTIAGSLPKGYDVLLEDYSDLEKVRKSAEKDAKLKEQIQQYALKVRPKWKDPKSEAALNHDATLLCAVDLVKSKNEKCWVLTLDRSLQMCAIDRAGPHGLSAALSISALIEILALNNAGPEFNTTDFAPLLSKLILNECIPPINTYVIQDLILLYKINQKAGELPAEYVKAMIQEVIKSRMHGGSSDSAALALKINRMFQEDLVNINQNIEDAKKQAKTSKDVAKEEKLKREGREKQLIAIKSKQIKCRALIKFIVFLLVQIIFASFISAALIKAYLLYFEKTKKDLIVYLLAILPFVLDAWKLIPKSWLNYKKAHDQAEQKATNEVANTEIGT